MPSPNFTAINPHGLTYKQEATIALATNTIKQGKPLNMIDIHKKVYSVENKANAASISWQNSNRLNYREAFIERMEELNIVGKNGKLEKVMQQGLDSTKVYNKHGDQTADYATRLSYAQELHKIIGAYAPTQTQQSAVNVNLDVSPEDLDTRIDSLTEELME